ncbi:MAG: DJ-1/PfpI family protein [Acidobacteriota bacterium]
MTRSADPIDSFEKTYGHVPGPRDQGRSVVVLLFEGIELLDFAGPTEAFHLANLAANARRPGAGYQYRLQYLTLDKADRVTTSAGLELIAHGVARDYTGDVDTLVIPGGAIARLLTDSDAINVVKRLAGRARRAASVCSGAFVLASTGLLYGRKATTHWRGCGLLAERFPDIRVELDAIFVRDGKFYTSAGSTAGIDLTLHLVEEDLGRDVSMHVARDLVVFLKRQGGQAQFSHTLSVQGTHSDHFRALLAWIPEHLDDDLRVERLAERARMSTRNFMRRFPKEIGVTPARYVEQVRVEAAKRQLETTSRSLEEIAADCGFGGRDGMRRSFVRVLGVGPNVYRRRFHNEIS